MTITVNEYIASYNIWESVVSMYVEICSAFLFNSFSIKISYFALNILNFLQR